MKMGFIHRTPTGLIVYGFPREEIKEKEVRLDDEYYLSECDFEE